MSNDVKTCPAHVLHARGLPLSSVDLFTPPSIAAVNDSVHATMEPFTYTRAHSDRSIRLQTTGLSSTRTTRPALVRFVDRCGHAGDVRMLCTCACEVYTQGSDVSVPGSLCIVASERIGKAYAIPHDTTANAALVCSYHWRDRVDAIGLTDTFVAAMRQGRTQLELWSHPTAAALANEREARPITVIDFAGTGRSISRITAFIASRTSILLLRPRPKTNLPFLPSVILAECTILDAASFSSQLLQLKEHASRPFALPMFAAVLTAGQAQVACWRGTSHGAIVESAMKLAATHTAQALIQAHNGTDRRSRRA